jgi:hypothetical protein
MNNAAETTAHLTGVDVTARKYRIERCLSNELWVIVVRAIIIRRQVRYKGGKFFFDVFCSLAFVLAVDFAQHVRDGSLVLFRHMPYFRSARRVPPLARISDIENISQVRAAVMIDKGDTLRALFYPPPEGFIPQRQRRTGSSIRALSVYRYLILKRIFVMRSGASKKVLPALSVAGYLQLMPFRKLQYVL